MRIKNEAEENTHALETKRLDSGWYEKYDITENEAGYLEELLRIDRALAECDNILSEVNLQIGYQRYESRIYRDSENAGNETGSPSGNGRADGRCCCSGSGDNRRIS